MVDQAAKLRERLKGIQQSSHAKTMAIVSGKGGVGKSNFALNFSISLADKGKKVLLFDLDVGMGNIDILLGKNAKYSIFNLLENKMSIYDIIEVGPNSLSYIAGGSGHNHIFFLDDDKLTYFLEQLELIMTEYDYILFDMGAGITRETIHYILAVDECILVTTPEPTAMTDAYSMVKQVLHHQSVPFHLIMNRATNQKQGMEMMNRMANVAKRFLQHDLHPLGIIPDDTSVTSAVIAQQPFILHNRQSKASSAVTTIASQYVGESVKNQDNVGFLSKLKRLLTER
ncbi:MinD/ParA family protein [Gracilibacillus caseinilyticus]|uniref:MinD/ParA family protein n=1 Tax=Gracilibacillus caseinilyticus TaxID=2932256 RepID=A0ABY4ETW7_9BACI|nr:MinD/ParA family protein [Gracilibacillus caseinilyticus]UOQ47858.1 MinD/ParA family protein [Gracilibacillus caseinilyticus]